MTIVAWVVDEDLEGDTSWEISEVKENDNDFTPGVYYWFFRADKLLLSATQPPKIVTREMLEGDDLEYVAMVLTIDGPADAATASFLRQSKAFSSETAARAWIEQRKREYRDELLKLHNLKPK
jgi:hypothetical protein